MLFCFFCPAGPHILACITETRTSRHQTAMSLAITGSDGVDPSVCEPSHDVDSGAVADMFKRVSQMKHINVP